MSNLVPFAPGMFFVPQENGMRVPGLVIASEQLLQEEEIDQPLTQVRNVAHLPGIVGYSIAMPDIHWGYGFPIGGVAAMDSTHGVISPGGVGYDINCGVRLALVPLQFSSLSANTQKNLLSAIFRNVPSGVGKGQRGHKLTDQDFKELTKKGARWSIEKGFGFPKDLEHTESHGVIEGADMEAVSAIAKARGTDQLGSIGSGNHFVELGEISQIYLPDIADAWGIEKGQMYVLIHSGSRGFGHQICQDTLNSFLKLGFAEGLPDKQLMAAPIQSEAGQRYFMAMAAAANFAFNNRQQILHEIRMGLKQVLGLNPEDIPLLYDVCHNIAKFETYEVDGVMKKLCVHRKGATRAFGPGAKELNPLFQKTGQPVMVPGDMGRSSHIMVGLGNPITWCSSCHGAGRAMSRHASLKSWKGKNIHEHMQNIGVEVMASSYRTIAEEMPNAYKDVNQVVEAVQEAKLAKMVAKLKPHLVVKG